MAYRAGSREDPARMMTLNRQLFVHINGTSLRGGGHWNIEDSGRERAEYCNTGEILIWYCSSHFPTDYSVPCVLDQQPFWFRESFSIIIFFL